MVAGACWAGIAGMLKVTRGVSEVISTIMLNAIAVLADRLPARQATACTAATASSTKPIPEDSLGRRASRCSRDARQRGLGAALSSPSSSASASGVLLNRTRFGFDLRATGASADRRGRQRRQRQADGA